jgi:solute carrier family 25 phosphate transporter 23/24/25/41
LQYFEESPDQPLSAVRRLVCGALAGITSVSVTYPLDIVRTRLSIQSASFSDLSAAVSKTAAGSASAKPAPPKLPGMWATLVLMYRNEGGVAALYRGILPTVAGVAPYVGLNFMVYESVRQYFTPEGQQNPSAVGKLCAGAISGAVAQTATYPL